MSDIAEMVESLKQLSEMELAEIRQKFWGDNASSCDFERYDFALDTAATNKQWPVDGYFLYAWTDGTLDGISIRPNSKAFPSIPLEEFGYQSAVGFDRVWITWTAQAGKTLSLFVGRRKGTHLSQVAMNAKGGGAGGVLNRGAWGHGHKNVTAAGTAEIMPTQIIPNGFKIVIRPLNSNTGLIFLGNSKANAEDTALRTELDFGESISLTITNLNLLYIDAEVSGEGVWYAVET